MNEINELGRIVLHASVLFRRRLDNAISNAMAEDSDSLSGRNFWILRYLEDHRDQDVFQKDLENTFKIRRSTISKTVELMEQKQLLERVPVNGDGRMKKLCLTPKADQVLADIRKTVDELECSLRESYSPEDYHTLMQLLKQFCGLLDASNEGPRT